MLRDGFYDPDNNVPVSMQLPIPLRKGDPLLKQKQYVLGNGDPETGYAAFPTADFDSD